MSADTAVLLIRGRGFAGQCTAGRSLSAALPYCARCTGGWGKSARRTRQDLALIYARVGPNALGAKKAGAVLERFCFGIGLAGPPHGFQ
jgi:hypothetical protein